MANATMHADENFFVLKNGQCIDFECCNALNTVFIYNFIRKCYVDALKKGLLMRFGIRGGV